MVVLVLMIVVVVVVVVKESPVRSGGDLCSRHRDPRLVLSEEEFNKSG